MPEEIKVAVIGGGNMGQHHARNYHEMAETQLVGIADPNPEVAALADGYGAKYYGAYQDMIDEEEPTAVSIAVPTPLHHSIASLVLGRGIHTLVEKPIAATLEEAEDLIAIANRQGVILTVGHIERYNPVVERLKQAIDSGRLGQISSVVSQRLGGFPQAEPNTDVIVDLAIHDIDIMNYLLGTPGELLASHGSRTFHSSEVDSAEILMNYGGVSGFIQANWITPVKIRHITITGSKGYVEANYITQQLTFYERMVIQRTEGFPEFVDKYGEPSKQISRARYQEPLRRELTAFMGAVAGEQADNLVAPEDAKIALKIAMSAVQSLKEKRHGT